MTDTSENINIPEIGFGTYDLQGDDRQIVLGAINSGFRLIDTARVYGSEMGVGYAIREAVDRGIINRSDLFIQTKLAPNMHGYYATLSCFEESINELQMDYIDMHLIHWPVSRGNEYDYREKNIESWQAFSELKKRGLVKHIGVCNFLERHLINLIDSGYGCPEVNQLELHPGYQQIGLVNFCRERDIVIEAWSPLGRGILDDTKYNEMAKKYNKNVGQLALRWSVQNGFIPLTRSSNCSRIKSNIDIFDFEITQEDIEEINTLNSNDNYQKIWSYKRQQMY